MNDIKKQPLSDMKGKNTLKNINKNINTYVYEYM